MTPRRLTGEVVYWLAWVLNNILAVIVLPSMALMNWVGARGLAARRWGRR